jgi:hypothetical protein
MTSLLLCVVLAQSTAQAPAPEPTALITGRVVDGVTKSPVSAAVVSLGSPGGTRRAALDSVLTDGDGRYFFDNVPTGRPLSITATKPGWLDGAIGRLRPEGESTPLSLKKDERYATVDLEMWRRSVLSGAVLDEAGEPVVDVLVWAVRRRIFAGHPQMELTTAVRTDDRGAFRLSGLVPGEYTVLLPAMTTSGPITFSGGNAPMEWAQTMTGVGAAPLLVERDNGVAAGDGRNVVTGMTGFASTPPEGAPWMTLPTTFLGGSTTTPSFVRLDPGQERQSLTIAARHVPTQSISGSLVVPGGSAASYALHLLPASMADFPLFDVATAIADAGGAFTFYGIPAGSYVIRVVRVPAPKGPNARAGAAYVDVNHKFMSLSSGGPRGGPPPPVDTEPLLFANEAVTVGETPVRGLTISMRAGVRITGRAEFVGTAPQPAPDALPNLTVEALPANAFAPYMAGQYNVGHFSADGTFTTPSLMPGRYVLTAGAPSPWTVKSITAGGVDVTGLPVDAMTDTGDIVVTYTDRAAAIRGTVSNQEGPDARVSVLMFPAMTEYWANYGNSGSRVRSARASATGTFSMAAPPPGEYLLIAVPEDQIADWRDPANLALLAPRAERVVVRDGESPTVNLTTVRIK